MLTNSMTVNAPYDFSTKKFPSDGTVKLGIFILRPLWHDTV